MLKLCIEDECDRKASKRQMCEKHYRRWWREVNREHSVKYNREYFKKNHVPLPPDRLIKSCFECGGEYRPSGRNQKYCSRTCQNRFHHRKKRYTNVGFKLKHNLRSRLRKAISGKDVSFSTYIGCSIADLKRHLESQFDSQMSWNNYGLNGWEIDHVKPLASFDLTDPEQLKKACHYSNLQPLWADDNRIKGCN